MQGEVVGITTAKFSGQSSSGVNIEGIGFAIPMDDVTGMIEDLKNFGYVTGAYLGVMVLDVDPTAQYYGIPAGAAVESTTAGGAAEKGGILAKDVITEVGGYPVTSVSDLTRVLRKFAAGDTVSVEVYRGGQTKTLTVTLDEKPREEVQPEPQTQEPQQPQQQMPGNDAFDEWYNYFKDYFGG
jgi:serine protease Do